MVLAYLKKEKGYGCRSLSFPRELCHFHYTGTICYMNICEESISCRNSIYKAITKEEFNASPGKKWRVKKDGRVIPIKKVDLKDWYFIDLLPSVKTLPLPLPYPPFRYTHLPEA